MEVLLGVCNKEVSSPNVSLSQMIAFYVRFQMESLSVETIVEKYHLGSPAEPGNPNAHVLPPGSRHPAGDGAEQPDVTCLLEVPRWLCGCLLSAFRRAGSYQSVSDNSWPFSQTSDMLPGV